VVESHVDRRSGQWLRSGRINKYPLRRFDRGGFRRGYIQTGDRGTRFKFPEQEYGILSEPEALQVRWGAPVSLESRPRRSPTPSSQSRSSTVEQPAQKAKPQQPRKSSLANMTASLEQLAVAHLSTPHPMEVEEEGDHSPTPPSDLRRSGSSRRQPVRADAPSSSRGAPSSRPPRIRLVESSTR
ncbi:hypothetical protein V3C99_015136, partial [Haemonchus contortus]